MVLDTHALIWLTEGQRRLGNKARRLTDEALARDALVVSAITFWEVAMLFQRGRIQLVLPAGEWRRTVLEQGVRELPLTGDVGIVAANLIGFHPDPADRFITATALLNRAPLLTADERILKWSGTLLRHDARQ